MINEHRKLAIQDLSNRGHDVSMEVNWNNTEQVKDNKFIKIRIKDGSEAIISRDHLFTMMLLLLPEEEQSQLIEPYANRIPVDNYRTQIEVVAQKDIKAGDLLVFPLTVSVNQRTGEMKIKP